MTNPIRGEATAKVGAVTITMALTMDGLARLSGATGQPTMDTLYRRLIGTEPLTTVTAINLLTVSGTAADGKPLKAQAAAAAATAGLSIASFAALSAAFKEMLLVFLKDEDEAQDTGNV